MMICEIFLFSKETHNAESVYEMCRLRLGFHSDTNFTASIGTKTILITFDSSPMPLSFFFRGRTTPSEGNSSEKVLRTSLLTPLRKEQREWGGLFTPHQGRNASFVISSHHDDYSYILPETFSNIGLTLSIAVNVYPYKYTDNVDITGRLKVL